MYWIDTSVMLERVMDMKRYQVSPSLPSEPLSILLSLRKSTTSLGWLKSAVRICWAGT